MIKGFDFGFDPAPIRIFGITPPRLVVTVTSLNPFVAAATPPDGYTFVAGNFSMGIPQKDGSFGVSQTVTLAISTAGAITEAVAGTVEAAIQAAGYGVSSVVPMTGYGVQTQVYVPPAGLDILMRTINRADVNGVSTTVITHPDLAIVQAATQLIALEVCRGTGSLSGTNFTIDGITSTALAAVRTVQTAGRAHLRGITNASGDALATVSFTGLSASASASGICVLFSINGATSYDLTHVEATTGALALSGTIPVLAGDLLVMVPYSLSTTMTGLVYTGAAEVSPMAQNETVAHFTGVAVQTISADNAAYPFGITWTSGGNSPALIVARIRH